VTAVAAAAAAAIAIIIDHVNGNGLYLMEWNIEWGLTVPCVGLVFEN